MPKDLIIETSWQTKIYYNEKAECFCKLLNFDNDKITWELDRKTNKDLNATVNGAIITICPNKHVDRKSTIIIYAKYNNEKIVSKEILVEIEKRKKSC